MKRNVLISAGIIFLFTLLLACKKEEKVIGGTGDTGYLEMKIDGTKRIFSDAEGRWVEGGNFLEITATSDGSEWVTITVMSDISRVPAGTYMLDDATMYTILSTYNDGSDITKNYTATRGTAAPEDAFALNISRIDNGSAEGTFSGTLVMVEGYTTLGLVNLSEGKFNVSIKPN